MKPVSCEILVDRVILESSAVPDGATLESIETPAAIVDLPVMAANLLRTAATAGNTVSAIAPTARLTSRPASEQPSCWPVPRA